MAKGGVEVKPADRAVLRFLAQCGTASAREEVFARAVLALDERLRALEPCPSDEVHMHVFIGQGSETACKWCGIPAPTYPKP